MSKGNVTYALARLRVLEDGDAGTSLEASVMTGDDAPDRVCERINTDLLLTDGYIVANNDPRVAFIQECGNPDGEIAAIYQFAVSGEDIALPIMIRSFSHPSEVIDDCIMAIMTRIPMIMLPKGWDCNTYDAMVNALYASNTTMEMMKDADCSDDQMQETFDNMSDAYDRLREAFEELDEFLTGKLPQ